MKMDITLSTKQTIAPNVIQFLALTKMTTQELSAYLNTQAMENPTIDIDALASAPFANHAQESIEWLSSFHPGKTETEADDSDKPDLFSLKEVPTSTPQLKDFLLLQLAAMPLPKTEEAIAKYLISCIDKYGYLSEDVSQVAKLLKVSPEQVEKCICLLRSLSPAGVCAADLRTCLLAQVDPVSSDPLVPIMTAIIENHLEDLAHGYFPSIAKKLRVPLPDVRAAADKISMLQPYPSAGFHSNTPNFFVYPDVSIDNVNGEIQVSLLSKFSPYLNVSKYYLDLYQTTDDPETKDYLNQKLQAAYQLFENIANREKTIFNCMEEIAKIQKDFFQDPHAVLIPMTLSDVADALDLSLSTVSRTLRGKYIQCCHGILPAKSLFTRKIKTTSYADCSSNEVKSVIKELVEHEDKLAPLSDAQISSICQHRGFVISRRTVAKYRTELGILTVSARKQYRR